VGPKYREKTNKKSGEGKGRGDEKAGKSDGGGRKNFGGGGAKKVGGGWVGPEKNLENRISSQKQKELGRTKKFKRGGFRWGNRR